MSYKGARAPWGLGDAAGWHGAVWGGGQCRALVPTPHSGTCHRESCLESWHGANLGLPWASVKETGRGSQTAAAAACAACMLANGGAARCDLVSQISLQITRAVSEACSPICHSSSDQKSCPVFSWCYILGMVPEGGLQKCFH